MHRNHGNHRRRSVWTWRAVLVAVGLTALLSIGETAPAQPTVAPTDEVIARVNGVPITVLELNRMFLAHVEVPYAMVEADPRAQEVRRQLLDALIDRALLVQRAKSLKITVPPQSLDEAVQGLVQRFPSRETFEEALKSEGLTVEGITDDLGEQILRKELVQKEIVDKISLNPNDIPGFYEQHQSRYMTQEQVRARHILIKVPPETNAADETKLRKRADGTLARARKGESFAKLAQEFSEDASRSNGGDLGFFQRGQMVAPFEEAAFGMKVGEISGLVRTPFGFHIIKVEERTAAKPQSFEEVKDQVREDLMREQTVAHYQEYVGGLRSKATIEVSLP
ncbi:MAG: peptidylprolyl isomerase [Candidatus Entotheonellia bacterium]